MNTRLSPLANLLWPPANRARTAMLHYSHCWWYGSPLKAERVSWKGGRGAFVVSLQWWAIVEGLSAVGWSIPVTIQNVAFASQPLHSVQRSRLVNSPPVGNVPANDGWQGIF